MSRLPWIEKYRPKHFDDIIGHTEKITTIRALIKNNELPHMLFYGPPGTGKTSVILAIARALYGDTNYRMYIQEINASKNRGIDTVRNIVLNFVKSRSDKVKLVILDEADAMTEDAQNALRGIIEKYSKNARFCLICNNINKINSAIKSRCTPMRFGSLPSTEILIKIKKIVELEKINISDEAINSLVKLETDFRKILNYLHGIHFLYSNIGKTIKKNDVYKFLGKPCEEDVNAVVTILFKGSFHEAHKLLIDMYRSNKWNVEDMLSYLLKKLLLLNIPMDQKHYLIEKMAEIEYRIQCSRSSEIQLTYLVSCFTLARTKLT
jgi:replication factor C subunit 3/5